MKNQENTFIKLYRYCRLPSLRLRLTVFVLAIAISIMLVSSVYIGRHAAAVIEQNFNQQLSATNLTLSTAVSVWLETHLKILHNLVTRPEIISMNPKTQKSVLERMGRSFPYMYLISTTGLGGLDVARNDNRPSKDYSDRLWFSKSRDGATVAYESLISKTVGKSAMAISMPIRNSKEEVVGVGMFSLNLDNLAQQVRVTKVGETGFAYVVDSQNKVIAHPDPVYVNDLRNLGNYAPVVALRNGRSGLMTFADQEGHRWRAHISVLDNGWGVLVQQREEELLSSQYLFHKVSISAILLAALTLTAMTWWVVRRSLKPVEVLTEAVTAISLDGRQHPDFTPVKQAVAKIGTRDEIGTLAESFNQMATHLEATLVSLEQELSERKLMEASLRENEEKYRSLVDNLNIGVYRSSADLNGCFLQANPAMIKMLGYDSTTELLRTPATNLYLIPLERQEYLDQVRIEGFVKDKELKLRKKDGTFLICSITGAAQYAEDGTMKWIDGVVEDITEIKNAELERVRLEETLRQSQKMESIGLLAGGIAHDFNNLLTPIIGYSEILSSGLSRDDKRFNQIQFVLQAAERARDLTQQLLVFSRKQIIELKTVDLGEIVRRFENMLRSTIRENVEIGVYISSKTSPVRADARQIEQVLVNLSVNAQDSMPEGGKLTIETMDIELDETYTNSHPEVPPGSYVMLSVADSGSGMDEETVEHIFEPFFTTKELGKGTGLGLSIVYGIVKQHGGSICVYSEKGIGTIFKIFIPKTEGELTELKDHSRSSATHPQGNETIVVVEDNDMVRLLVCDMLKNIGYNVISTESPEKCLDLVRQCAGEIDLLLTDVVMPGMNGKALYDRLCAEWPGLKVVFMSGYSSNIITEHGVLNEDVNFIQKPFALLTMTEKIRQVLDS